MDEDFTQAQKDAVDSAWKTLTEHFPNVILAVATTCGSGDNEEATQYLFHGGRVGAIGLAHQFRSMLQNPPNRGLEEDRY